ncbi:MAG: hypothetical protein V4513_07805 [Pseudomonadota bacterium]
MTARVMIIAAAALSLSTGAFAGDPAKPDSRDPQASAPAAKELVLASADVKSPSPNGDPQVTAPVKRRTARVTTCRCGDPQPQDEQQ